MNLQMNSRYIVFIVFCVCGLLEKAVCVNESITVSNIANFSIKISINLLKKTKGKTLERIITRQMCINILK